MLSKMRVKPRIWGLKNATAWWRPLVDVIREAPDRKLSISEADQDVHLAEDRRLTERWGDLGRRVQTGRSATIRWRWTAAPRARSVLG
jgi:argininosuccinate lyase